MRFRGRAHAVLIAVAAGLLAVLPATSVAATSPPRCSLKPTGGTVTRTLGAREYLLRVPAGLSRRAVPLVVSLHGGGQPVRFHQSETGWNDFAADHGFIVAYPEARRNRFPNWDYSDGSADVAFLRKVVAHISRTWCVRARRVYAEGYSNGALLAERLACDAGNLFAAVAAYAGGFPGQPCRPDRPIAVGIFQGILDPASSYPIGLQNRDRWLSINGCPSKPTTEPRVLVEAARYAPCDGGVEVVWRVYLQSHNWPYGDDNADIRKRIWRLFRRNPKPAAKLRPREPS